MADTPFICIYLKFALTRKRSLFAADSGNAIGKQTSNTCIIPYYSPRITEFTEIRSKTGIGILDKPYGSLSEAFFHVFLRNGKPGKRRLSSSPRTSANSRRRRLFIGP